MWHDLRKFIFLSKLYLPVKKYKKKHYNVWITEDEAVDSAIIIFFLVIYKIQIITSYKNIRREIPSQTP